MKVLFEDAIIAATALRETAEYIITRNVKDFGQSPISAVTPSDFLRSIPSLSSAPGGAKNAER